MDKKIVMNRKKKIPLIDKFFILSFTILPVLNFLVFYVYINFNSFLMAFQRTITEGSSVRVEWTFEQFGRVWESLGQKEMPLAILNTLKTFAITMVMYPIGILVSYFLYKRIRGHFFFRILFYIPSIVSSIVFSYFYIRLTARTGPIAELIWNMTGTELPPELLADPQYANLFVWINMIWLTFPGDLIIWSGTFSRIPDSVLEYAKLDGVGWVREIVQIILPMVWPTFSLFLILRLGGIFGASGNVFLLTQGAGDTTTLSYWFYWQVYSTTNPYSNQFNYMSAWGFCITVIACTISFVSRRFLAKLVPDVEF